MCAFPVFLLVAVVVLQLTSFACGPAAVSSTLFNTQPASTDGRYLHVLQCGRWQQLHRWISPTATAVFCVTSGTGWSSFDNDERQQRRWLHQQHSESVVRL